MPIPNGPEPSVSLYWFDDADPTIAPGMSAPLYQLLVRTDLPSVYVKVGPLDTDWTLLGSASGGGGGHDVIVDNQGGAIPGNPFQVLNFTGAGVVASNAGGSVADITIPGTIIVEDEGIPLANNPHRTMNFVGAGVTAADAGGGVATITVPGGVTLQDEGIAVTGNPHSTLNFVGPGITCTDVAGVGTITVAGAVTKTVTVANTPYTILSTDDYLFVDTSGGAITLVLPDPTSFGFAKEYFLIDSTGNFATNNVTLSPHGAESIEGLAANKVFQTAWGGWTIVTDGTNWFVY